MLSRIVQRRLAAAIARTEQAAARRTCLRSNNAGAEQRRWITPAPKQGDGPLMTRRADRELPDVDQVGFRWGRTFPIFAVLVAACSVAIFNYQKSSSPVIASTMYALRTSPKARQILGDEIYFKHQIPWISGEMNQMHGHIDVYFSVRGTKGTAVMRFTSRRPTSRSLFETSEWSLKTEDGRWVDLLDDGDPFKGILADESLPELEEDRDNRRGFRQQGQLNK